MQCAYEYCAGLSETRALFFLATQKEIGMEEAEDTADCVAIYETNFVDDIETKAFLLARWLDTG